MRRDICPFCGMDPYEHVDIGVGFEAVAVTCCENGVAFFDWRIDDPEIDRIGTLLMSGGRRARRGERLLENLEKRREEEAA